MGAETGSGASLPELQIWQNTGGSSYTKANFSILSSSTAPDSNNVAEYIPNPPLQFQEGDILGVYQPSTGRQNRLSTLVVYYQDRDGPVNYEEGNSALSTVTLDTPDNQYNYPLVTVEISTAGMVVVHIIALQCMCALCAGLCRAIIIGNNFPIYLLPRLLYHYSSYSHQHYSIC